MGHTPKPQSDVVLELPDGSRREFRMRQIVTLNIRAWWQRTMEDIVQHTGAEPDQIPVATVLDYILSDAARVQKCLQVAYDGDHSGIAWGDDVDVQQLEVMLSGFFLITMLKRYATSSGSSTSSSPTATGSLTDTTTTEAANDSFTTNAPGT